jgi:hypothetical protein
VCDAQAHVPFNGFFQSNSLLKTNRYEFHKKFCIRKRLKTNDLRLFYEFAFTSFLALFDSKFIISLVDAKRIFGMLKSAKHRNAVGNAQAMFSW